MDDKTIKQMLKDASVWLNEAARAWPKKKDIAAARLNGANVCINSVYYRVIGSPWAEVDDDKIPFGLFTVSQGFLWASEYYSDDRDRALKEFDMAMEVLGTIYNSVIANRPLGAGDESDD